MLHAADNLAQRTVGIGADDIIGQIAIPAGGSGSAALDRACVSLILSNAGPDPVYVRWDTGAAPATGGLAIPPYAVLQLDVHAGEGGAYRWGCLAGQSATLCFVEVLAK